MATGGPSCGRRFICRKSTLVGMPADLGGGARVCRGAVAALTGAWCPPWNRKPPPHYCGSAARRSEWQRRG